MLYKRLWLVPCFCWLGSGLKWAWLGKQIHICFSSAGFTQASRTMEAEPLFKTWHLTYVDVMEALSEMVHLCEASLIGVSNLGHKVMKSGMMRSLSDVDLIMISVMHTHASCFTPKTSSPLVVFKKEKSHWSYPSSLVSPLVTSATGFTIDHR